MMRVIRAEGIIRVFPIEPEQLKIVETFFQNLKNISFSIKRIETADKSDYGNLLTVVVKSKI